MLKRLLAILALLSSHAFAAIAPNAGADLGTNGGSSQSYSASYTVSSGANRMLAATVYVLNASDILSGCTYAGASMTVINKEAVAANRWLYAAFILGPTSGANNLICSISGGVNKTIGMAAADYTGVAQSGQPDNSILTASANVNSSTVSLTTVANNCWTLLYR